MLIADYRETCSLFADWAFVLANRSCLIANAKLNEIDERLSDRRTVRHSRLPLLCEQINGLFRAQNQMQLNLNLNLTAKSKAECPRDFLGLCLAFITCRNYIAMKAALAATFKAAHWFGSTHSTLTHGSVQWLVINQSKRNFSQSIKSITKSAIFSEPRMLSCLCHVEQSQLPVGSCQFEWRQRPYRYVYAPVGTHAKDIEANEWMPNPRQSIVCFYIMLWVWVCVCVCVDA